MADKAQKEPAKNLAEAFKAGELVEFKQSTKKGYTKAYFPGYNSTTKTVGLQVEPTQANEHHPAGLYSGQLAAFTLRKPGRAKLSAADAKKVRDLLAEVREIGKKYKV